MLLQSTDAHLDIVGEDTLAGAASLAGRLGISAVCASMASSRPMR
jgi:hypothetical protein